MSDPIDGAEKIPMPQFAISELRDLAVSSETIIGENVPPRVEIAIRGTDCIFRVCVTPEDVPKLEVAVRKVRSALSDFLEMPF
ncbi:MAG: hypothetical protein F4Z65_01810 [Acidobacteria bacterium]|nr:hypothetical protein [Acidobacteriota bacterium]MYA44768.1 hypothetical protein [Acidobacteriota bacterium]MYI40076.1 hypothetical protein [Acidobacteriota bacterium]